MFLYTFVRCALLYPFNIYFWRYSPSWSCKSISCCLIKRQPSYSQTRTWHIRLNACLHKNTSRRQLFSFTTKIDKDSLIHNIFEVCLTCHSAISIFCCWDYVHASSQLIDIYLYSITCCKQHMEHCSKRPFIMLHK